MTFNVYEIGERVLVIKDREEILGEKFSGDTNVPIGWEGTVIRRGLAHRNNKLFNAYDLQGDDGRIIKEYPASGIMRSLPGAKRNAVKIIERTVPFIDDSAERAELYTAIQFVMEALGKNEIEFMLHLIYVYGKTAGVRQERQRKKSLKTTLARQI